MTLIDPEPWRQIKTWPLPGTEVQRGRHKPPKQLTFAESLEEDHTIYQESANGVEAEYRRWLCLCAMQGRRLQGSEWIAKAEQYHRKDPANWQRLLDGPLATVTMGEPIRRCSANDADYPETLALYAGAFPSGMVFGKVWPRLWKERFARRHPVGLAFAASFIGLALIFMADWEVLSTIWAMPTGIFLFILGLMAGTIFIDFLTPWQNDDSGH